MKHPSSFGGIRVAQYLVVCIVFCRSLFVFYRFFSFGRCIVCPSIYSNCIGGVMVSVLDWDPVGRVKPKIIQLAFVASPLSTQLLRRKSKYLLARNRLNVFEWGDMSIRVLLFQWASTTNPTKRVSQYKLHFLVNLIILLKINLFSPRYSRGDAELTLNNNHLQCRI